MSLKFTSHKPAPGRKDAAAGNTPQERRAPAPKLTRDDLDRAEAEKAARRREAAERAKAEAAARKAGETEGGKELGGPDGPEPTRYGDWERKGRCFDF